MNKTKTIILIAIVAALLTAGAVVFAGRRTSNEVQHDPSIASEKQKIAEQDSSTTSTSGDTSATKPAASKDEEGEEAPSNVIADITTAAQRDKQLLVRAVISGASSGTCTLTLSQGTKTVTKQAPIGVQASYAICQGFNVPVGELSIGTWTVKVAAETPNGSASDTTKVDIE